MLSATVSRLRKLCDALPKSTYDERFASLPTGQRLLALVVTGAVVLAVPPLLTSSAGARVAVAGALVFGVLYALVDLLAWYNRQQG